MAQQPIFTARLTGDTDVQTLSESITWVPKDKIESIFSMTASSAPKSIDFSNVSNIKTIVFFGDANYTVSITTQIGTDPTNTIAFETNDFFIFSPPIAFVGTITDISVSTTNVNTTNIQVRIYGQA